MDNQRKIKKHNSIILGGGIAGLLYRYFNPEATIVSYHIGGQFLSNFQLGPKYFHADEHSKRFLNEIDLKAPIKKIKVGYFYDEKLREENSEENRKRYFKKTRGDTEQPYKSIMSSNKSEFDSFDVNILEMIEKLIEKTEKNMIINEEIIKINLINKKILTKNREIKYDKLISTIPLNTFLFLCNKIDSANQLKSYPTTFVLNDSIESCPFDNFKNFDYIYFSEPEYKFHRVTKTDDGFIFEFRGDDIEEMNNEIDRFKMKVGQLVHNDIKINIKDVTFFGRYGKWRHNILINNLIKQLYENK